MTKDEKRKERDKALQEYYRMQLEQNSGCAAPTWTFLILLILLLVGCKTVYVPTPEYYEVHDTIVKKEVVEKEVIKEVTVRDSVSFLVKGDTIRIERWHYERDFRYEKALQATIDSLTKLQRDSVPYPVEVVREVEKPLKNWQNGLIWWGVICTLALIVSIYIRVRFPKARSSK